MATVKVSTTKSCARAINYAEKRAQIKDGVNCDIDHAKQEMSLAREMNSKPDGTQAHLVIQSFSPEESQQLGAEKINQLGVELAERIAPGHQVAVYTHVDKEHYHNHIVINAVNLETGHKYHQHNEFEYVKGFNDELLKEHHLEIIQPKRQYEKLTSPEVQMKRRGRTPWKDEVRRAIDRVMADRSVSSYGAFKEHLADSGIIVHDRGKNVTYELLDGNKRIRGRRLGSSYERDTLRKEFASRLARQRQLGDKPLNRAPHSLKNQQIMRRQAQRSKALHEFQQKVADRRLTPHKRHFVAFKASKPLEQLSPVAYLFRSVRTRTISHDDGISR